MSALRRAGPLLALIVITAIWGWTFVVVRTAVSHYPVLAFLAVRFGIAAVALSPALLRRGGGVKVGLMPGVFLAVGYCTQTVGLHYTTASKAGLLTGLFVVFTPLLSAALERRRPSAITLAAVSMALIGTVLLAGPNGATLDGHELLGDALELATAIIFAIHILLLSRFAPGQDVARFAFAQLSVCFLLFVAGASFSGGIPMPSTSVWFALVVTGLFATALAFWVQSHAQQRISATRTAVILAAEPAFATLFGVLLAGDRFTVIQAAGAGLILVAVTGHEVLPGRTTESLSAAT